MSEQALSVFVPSIVLSDPPSCLSHSSLFSSYPCTLRFEQQVLLNPVIAISGEEIKAMQQFWGQNICFPTHLSLRLSLRPPQFDFYRCPNLNYSKSNCHTRSGEILDRQQR